MQNENLLAGGVTPYLEIISDSSHTANLAATKTNSYGEPIQAPSDEFVST